MNVQDFTAPQDVLAGLRVANKTQALRELARRAASSAGLDRAVVEKALLEREQLGSTGIGKSVALPHARIPGLAKFYGVFARLERPIDFDAIDGQPVDLVFLLLAPDNAAREQIAALACISHLFRDAGACDRLRRAKTTNEIYEIITARPPLAAP